MKYLLIAGDGSNDPDNLIPLSTMTIEAPTIKDAKSQYCRIHKIKISEFAKRHWDLLSGSCNYMWIEEEEVE